MNRCGFCQKAGEKMFETKIGSGPRNGKLIFKVSTIDGRHRHTHGYTLSGLIRVEKTQVAIKAWQAVSP